MVDQKVNTAWFKEQLANRKLSERSLSAHLQLDPASVNKMLKGKRKMQIHEARGVAEYLRVPVDEVMDNAGLRYFEEGPGPGMHILAEIDASGAMHTQRRATRVASYVSGVMVDITQAINDHHTDKYFIGAVIRASSGPLALFDDALLLFSASPDLDDRAVGTLAIVEQRGGGKFLARIEKARKSGSMTIRKVDGDVVDIDVISATPVEIIRP